MSAELLFVNFCILLNGKVIKLSTKCVTRMHCVVYSNISIKLELLCSLMDIPIFFNESWCLPALNSMSLFRKYKILRKKEVKHG